MTISSQEADEMTGEEWFTGYTKIVEVFEDPVVIEGDFDCNERSEAKRSDEYIIFKNGLEIRGTMRLGSDSHSILVVFGDLHVNALELGDAVLVVKGNVISKNYIFTPTNDGIFEVAGKQDKFTPGTIITQIFFWRSPENGDNILYKNVGSNLKKIEESDYDEDFIDANGEAVPKKILESFKKGDFNLQ